MEDLSESPQIKMNEIPFLWKYVCVYLLKVEILRNSHSLIHLNVCQMVSSNKAIYLEKTVYP